MSTGCGFSHPSRRRGDLGKPLEWTLGKEMGLIIRMVFNQEWWESGQICFPCRLRTEDTTMVRAWNWETQEMGGHWSRKDWVFGFPLGKPRSMMTSLRMNTGPSHWGHIASRWIKSNYPHMGFLNGPNDPWPMLPKHGFRSRWVQQKDHCLPTTLLLNILSPHFCILIF